MMGIVIGLHLPAKNRSDQTEIITGESNDYPEQSVNLNDLQESDSSFQEIYPDSGDSDSGVFLDSTAEPDLSPDSQAVESDIIVQEVSEPDVVVTVDSSQQTHQIVDDLEDFEDVDISETADDPESLVPVDTSYQQLDTLEDF